MSESKIQNFGSRWVEAIQKHIDNNPLPTLTLEQSICQHPLPYSNLSHFSQMSMTHRVTIQLFNARRKPEEISRERNLAVSTIMNHICSALRQGMDIDIGRLIGAQRLYRIIRIVQQEPINNDITKLTPIKNLCSPETTFEDVKTALAYISCRQHLKSLGVSYIDPQAIVIKNNEYKFQSYTILPTMENIFVMEDDKHENSTISKLNAPVDIDTNSDVLYIQDSSYSKPIISNDICEKSNSSDVKCVDRPPESVLVCSSNAWDENDDLLMENMCELDNLEETQNSGSSATVSSVHCKGELKEKVHITSCEISAKGFDKIASPNHCIESETQDQNNVLLYKTSASPPAKKKCMKKKVQKNSLFN